jgi:cation-transporting ATPase I
MSLADSVRWVKKRFGPRTRRTYVTSTRVHVEFREMSGDKLAAFVKRIGHVAADLDRLAWFDVHVHTRRVVFAFAEGEACAPDELSELVDQAEQAAHTEFPDKGDFLAGHPGDAETLERLALEAAAELGAFVLGGALRLSPMPASGIASNATAVLAVLRAVPRLRRKLDEALGAERADHSLNLLESVTTAFAQRPIASLVGLAHKRILRREAEARRESWRQREPELCRQPISPKLCGTPAEPRPRPVPRGPIEEYADRAWVLSLAGFGVSFLSTRSFQRAVGALFGALPRPARLGREAFSADLGRVLSNRGVVVLDPEALRRLDRLDCLVVQDDLFTRDRFEIGEVTVASDLDAAVGRERVKDLFDPEHPLEVCRRDGWALGPPALLGAELCPELAERAATLGRRGALVLALVEGERALAAVEVRIIPQAGAEELLGVARGAGLRVVVSVDDEAALGGESADDVVPAGRDLVAAVRQLQAEGRCVCLVATGRNSDALAHADCGIGLIRTDEPPPWGADFICREDLTDAQFLVEACVSARQVAKQSVNIALGAATLGAMVSAGGIVPMTMRRVMSVVNVATLLSMANGAKSSSRLERRELGPARDRTPWHALDAQGVLARLGTSERGLGEQAIVERTERQRRRRSALAELGDAVTDELFNPLAPLLAAGAALSAVVGSTADAAIVGGVIVVDALIGGVQRFRTERAIRELARTTERKVVTRRGGLTYHVEVGELVRGDVIELFPGDVVPADCRLLEAISLEVDGSTLTGESLPVRKSAEPCFAVPVPDRTSMLFEGTSVASGCATAVVVAVGDQTEARHGAAAAPRGAAPSGVDARLRSVINLTGPMALGAGVGLVGVGLLRGRRVQDLIGAGVSLAVASVPEGLPLLATAAQLAAAKRLAARGTLVRNTRSIEALGRVDVLCLDKTGTLTEGRIEVTSVSDSTSEERLGHLGDGRREVLAVALRATGAPRHSEGSVDPVDAALLRAGTRVGTGPELGCVGWRRQSELPFAADRGYHAVLGRADRGWVLSVKGAPEVVVSRSRHLRRGDQDVELDDRGRRAIEAVANRLAERGLRVLAVAERLGTPGEPLGLAEVGDLVLRGLVAFTDPVRPAASRALDRLGRAGVRAVMVTGDHARTARAIAAELGLTGEALSGEELMALSDVELDQRLPDVGIFARVSPAQKVRIVRAFERTGHVVAMVGDGANDAPAIRLANVGIAIGERSTAAARAVADVVVTDERIETVVDAIVEGRAMWASVRDAVSILVGGNLGEIGFTLAAGLVDGKSPLNARQLLLVNLLTDVAPAMAIALRPPSGAALMAIANEGPEASLGDPLSRDIAVRAVVTGLGAGGAWLIGRVSGSASRARTIGLVALVGTQLGQTLVSGGPSRPVLTTSLASAALLAAIVQTPGISRFFGCRPLGPGGWLTALGASAAATTASVMLPRALSTTVTRLGLDRAVAWGEQTGALAPVEEVPMPSGRNPTSQYPPSQRPSQTPGGQHDPTEVRETGP